MREREKERERERESRLNTSSAGLEIPLEFNQMRFIFQNTPTREPYTSAIRVVVLGSHW